MRGCSSIWLERRPVTPEVASSSLVTPATPILPHRLPSRLFFVPGLGAAPPCRRILPSSPPSPLGIGRSLPERRILSTKVARTFLSARLEQWADRMSAPLWVPRKQPAPVIPQPARCPCRSGKCARLRPTVAPCSFPASGDRGELPPSPSPASGLSFVVFVGFVAVLPSELRPRTEKRRHPRVPPLRAALTRPSKLCDADHSVSPSTGARSPAGRRGISGCRGEARWGKWEPGRPVDRVGLIPGMCQTTDAVACARRTDVS